MTASYFSRAGIAGGRTTCHSYNYGAGNGERTISSVKAAIWMGSVFFAGSFLLVITVPEPLIRIFNADDPQLLSMAVRGIRIAYSGVLFASVSVIASHAFQAIGKARLGIFLTLSRHFLFILLPLYFLPPLLGTDGIWLSIPLSDLGGGIIGAWFLKREFRLIREREQFGRVTGKEDSEAADSV